MFRFYINQKNFNFFNRKENNFLYRLTSYRAIRIPYKQNTNDLQSFYNRLTSDLQLSHSDLQLSHKSLTSVLQ